VCRVQRTKSSPPKLVLASPLPTIATIMHCLILHPNIEDPSPMLQIEIDGLTRNDRCFTLEEP
jgi:hypothetical protein